MPSRRAFAVCIKKAADRLTAPENRVPGEALCPCLADSGGLSGEAPDDRRDPQPWGLLSKSPASDLGECGVWRGLAGFCPGPALVALGMGDGKAGIFVAAMLAGMALFAWRNRTDAP